MKNTELMAYDADGYGDGNCMIRAIINACLVADYKLPKGINTHHDLRRKIVKQYEQMLKNYNAMKAVKKKLNNAIKNINNDLKQLNKNRKNTIKIDYEIKTDNNNNFVKISFFYFTKNESKKLVAKSRMKKLMSDNNYDKIINKIKKLNYTEDNLESIENTFELSKLEFKDAHSTSKCNFVSQFLEISL